jgi:integrase
MGRIYRQSKTGPWWGDWTDPNGKRHRRSLRTDDKAVARERLRGHELAATPQARGRRQRLSEALGDMIATLHDKAEATREMYREKGRRLIKTLGDPWVHEIDRDLISGYIAKRLNETDEEHGQASPHTISKELITLRRALRESHERGVLPTMPAFPRFSPRYVPREVWLTPDQFDRVCAELEPKRALWASLAALGGLRAGEIERQRWETLAERLMRVQGTKTERSKRTVPIAPALQHRLDQVPPAARRGRVVEPWGNVRRDLRAAVARANAAAAAAAELAGASAPEPIPFVSPNDLRRTFASWLAQNGVPLLVIATLLGHSSTRMVEKVYGRLSAKNMDDAIAVLPVFGEVRATTSFGPVGTMTTVCAEVPGSGRELSLQGETEDPATET